MVKKISHLKYEERLLRRWSALEFEQLTLCVAEKLGIVRTQFRLEAVWLFSSDFLDY